MFKGTSGSHLNNDILTYFIRSLTILLKKFYISMFSLLPLCIFCLSQIWTVTKNSKQNTLRGNLSITNLPYTTLNCSSYRVFLIHWYFLLINTNIIIAMSENPFCFYDTFIRSLRIIVQNLQLFTFASWLKLNNAFSQFLSLKSNPLVSF